MKLLKALILLAFLVLVSFDSDAQETETIIASEQKAEPYEGLQNFYAAFMDKIKMPKLKRDENQVKVVLSFIVEKDGSFSNIKVESGSEEVGKAVKRTLETMPKWKPGYKDGQAVRSSFKLPVTIKVNDNESEKQFLKEVAAYCEVLKKYEQETDYFKFNCNCVTLTAVIEPDGSSELFQYETLDNIGLYNISIKKFEEVNEKLFFKDLIKQISKSEAKYKKVKLGNLDALNVQWSEIWQEKNVYHRTIFYFDKNILYSLNFASNSTEITNIVFEELLQSFQVKQ